MTDASTSLDMSTELRKVAERAKREPAGRFHSLAHLTWRSRPRKWCMSREFWLGWARAQLTTADNRAV